MLCEGFDVIEVVLDKFLWECFWDVCGKISGVGYCEYDVIVGMFKVVEFEELSFCGG